jgi:amino acid permease
VTHVSSVTQSGTRSSGKLVGTVILAIVGIVAVIVGLIYVIEPARSLPTFLGREVGSSGHRPLHAVAALVVGVVLLALSGWTSFRSKSGSASSAGN